MDYLTEKITDDDVRHMELALVGKILGTLSVEEEEEAIRDVLLRRTSRFHLVKAACWPNATGTIQYFDCDFFRQIVHIINESTVPVFPYIHRRVQNGLKHHTLTVARSFLVVQHREFRCWRCQLITYIMNK
jgi:hypothetical protein